MEHKNVRYCLTFLELAERDLKSCEKEIEIGNYHTAIYFAQQVVEKCLKAVLFLKGYRIYEHKVSSEFVANVLAYEQDDKWIEKLREAVHIAIDLEERGLRAKYPMEKEGTVISPIERFSKEEAEEFYEKAKRVYETIREYLSEKFGIQNSRPSS